MKCEFNLQKYVCPILSLLKFMAVNAWSNRVMKLRLNQEGTTGRYVCSKCMPYLTNTFVYFYSCQYSKYEVRATT